MKGFFLLIEAGVEGRPPFQLRICIAVRRLAALLRLA